MIVTSIARPIAESIGLGIAQQGGGGNPYSAEANALFARFTTPATPARKVLINNLIVALKAAGVWSKLDALVIEAAETAQAALQNWVANRYNPTLANSPAFTADRGHLTDGSTSYLDTGFNPSTAVAAKYVLNDAHMGLYSRTQAVASFDLGARTTSTTNQAVVGVLGAATTAITRINQDAGYRPNNAASLGHFVSRRTASNALAAFMNGSSLGSGDAVPASTAMPNLNFYLGGGNTGGVFGAGSARQYAGYHIGGGLTDAEILATYNAIQAYMTAIGANV